MGSTCCFGEGHGELAQLSPLFVLLCACHAAFVFAASVFVFVRCTPVAVCCPICSNQLKHRQQLLCGHDGSERTRKQGWGRAETKREAHRNEEHGSRALKKAQFVYALSQRLHHSGIRSQRCLNSKCRLRRLCCRIRCEWRRV